MVGAVVIMSTIKQFRDGGEVPRWYEGWYYSEYSEIKYCVKPGHITHNTSGPAVIFPDGQVLYYIDGLRVSYKQFIRDARVIEYTLNMILELS